MTTSPPARGSWRLLALAIAMVLFGGVLAAAVQTDAGRVSVSDTNFVGADGQSVNGLLYVPDGVDADNPAPAALVVHGYINSRETQSPTAIELARRGHVVLSMDQAGHGGSDAPAFNAGFGGPAGLEYLSSLDVVDSDNVALVGHSMGGWAVLHAAATHPDAYQALVLVGSATAPAGPSTGGGEETPEGTADFPRNTAVVYGVWEEFSPTMWFTDNPRDVMATEQMMTLFGTDEEVREDELYGSVEEGTARVLHRPLNTHPGLTHDPRTVTATVDWLDQTLEGNTSASGQTWWLKELGTLIALLGGILAVFASARLLLRTPYFARLRQSAQRPEPVTGRTWWIFAAIATLVPAVTFLPVMAVAPAHVPVNALLPQQITSWIVVWALLNALITTVLLALWHRTRSGGAALGLAPGWSVVGRSLLLAALSVGSMLALVFLSDLVFTTDFRFWVIAVRPPTALQAVIFLVYLAPMAAFFLALSALLNTQLRVDGRRKRGYLAAGLVPVAGVAALIVVDYVPLLAGGGLLFPSFPLHIIVAYQVVVLLAVAGLLCVALYRWTGTLYPGAFAAAILVTWAMTAGTATQFPLDQWDPLPWAVRVALPALVAAGLLFLAVRRSRSTTDTTSESTAA